MKKLLMLAPLLLAGCFYPKTEVRLESRVDLSNGKHFRWNCEYGSTGCHIEDFKAARKVSTGYYSDTEYFCDLTGKFYIVRMGTKENIAYEQKGITCKYTLDRMRVTKMVDGTKKVEHEYFVKD